MPLRKSLFYSFGRGAVLATVAAVALAAIQPSVATAGTATPSSNGLSLSHGSSGNTDISAAGRRHYHGGGGGAAAMAAFAGIVGTIGTIAAAQERRDYYESGPAYYSGGPAYYGGGPAYYNSPGYGYYGGYGGPDAYTRRDRTYN